MAVNEIVAPVLGKLTRGQDLSPDDIEAALGELFEGRVSDVQAAAFIVALRTKGETEGELVALVSAMHRFGTPVTVADGAIDTCGTGGDRSGSVNVSTMAALIAAGAGARRRETRQPCRLVASRLGRRARGARCRDRHRPRGRGAVRGGSGDGVLLRPPLSPLDALPRPGPRRDRGADDLQLPRPARQPGTRPPPSRGRLRLRDGDAHARRAPRARYRTRDGVLRSTTVSTS